MNVMLVDGSAAVRARLATRLLEAGLAVTGEADSVAGAVAISARAAPDAVVFDLWLPDLRGMDVVVALRRAAPSALLLILTNAQVSHVHCVARGADFVLDKSAAFDRVGETLLAGARASRGA
jgi:DNA-binding response OmpR family regulator